LDYKNLEGVRHIHSIHDCGDQSHLLIATGDKNKMLDQWRIDSDAFYSNDNRYILSINIRHKPIDDRLAACIFDTKNKECIFSDYILLSN